MSWAALAPTAKASKGTIVGAVTVSVTNPGRYPHRVYVTVRRDLLPVLTWWTYRAAVTVEIGQDEHAGRVRISPGGQHTIMPAFGRRPKTGMPKANAPVLQVANLPGAPEGGLKRTDVAWEVLGDVFVINLPWGGAKGAVKAEPASPRESVVPGTTVDMPPSPRPPVVPAPPRPAPAPAPPPAAPSPRQPAKVPVSQTYGEIERWAIEHGVGSSTHGFSLVEVNAKRATMGLGPVSIRKTVRHSESALRTAP